MTLQAGLGANSGVEEAPHLICMFLQVMCAHKDQAFMDAAKLAAKQPGSLPTSPDSLHILETAPRGPPAFPSATDPSAALPDRAPSAGSGPAEAAHSAQDFQEVSLGSPRSAEQVSAQPGTTTQQQQHTQAGVTGAHAAGLSGMLAGAGAHTEEQSQASGGLSDSRHRNSSTVSLCSLAGSDISNCSSTYVTELPEGFSLFYENLD